METNNDNGNNGASRVDNNDNNARIRTTTPPLPTYKDQTHQCRTVHEQKEFRYPQKNHRRSQLDDTVQQEQEQRSACSSDEEYNNRIIDFLNFETASETIDNEFNENDNPVNHNLAGITEEKRSIREQIHLVEHVHGWSFQHTHEQHGSTDQSDKSEISSTSQTSFGVNNRNTVQLPTLSAELVAVPVIFADLSNQGKQQESTPLAIATPIQQITEKLQRRTLIREVTLLFCIVLITISVVVPIMSQQRKGNENDNNHTKLNSTATYSTLSPSSGATNSSTTDPSYQWQSEWFQFGNDIDQKWSCDEGEGTSLAISRNGLTLASGGSGFEVNIYKYARFAWSWEICINSSDAFDGTGKSVALDDSGNIVAVGSPGNESSNIPGIVRVLDINNITVDLDYFYNCSNYNQKGSDIIGAEMGDNFGSSIDLSDNGDIVAVASQRERECSVEAFQYSNETSDWSKHGQVINCIGKYSDVTGISVSLSGDGSVLVIGEVGQLYETDSSEKANRNGMKKGYFSAYKFNDTAWMKLGQTIESITLQDEFGVALTISNDGQVMAACAPFNDSNTSGNQVNLTGGEHAIGSCRVHRYYDTIQAWQQLGSDIEGSKLFDIFGSSVSLDASGNVIAIGAPGSDVHGKDSGYVRILEYDVNKNLWQRVGRDIIGRYAFAESGLSVALSADGDVVVIGSPGMGTGGDGCRDSSVDAYETGVIVDSGEISITIDIGTGSDPYGISWFIERIDVERNETVQVISIEEGTYTDDITKKRENTTLRIPSGGVYRFLFRTGSDNIADFIINIEGQPKIKSPVQMKDYTQTTFYAGQLTNATKTGKAFVTLRILFDEHPYDVHWVMLKSELVLDSKNGKNIIENNRTVLAFGPEREYKINNRTGNQYIETIDVSSVTGDSKIIFILTDDGRDGLCCEYGSGWVAMYNGTSATNNNENELIFNSSAEGMRRFVETFRLYG